MNFRLGLILASSLALATGACAASGGAAGTGTDAGGVALAQGERPRDDDFTEEAERQLGLAALQSTEEGAAPFFEAALTAADQAIAADSTNPLAHLLAAQAHMGLGAALEADAAFDRAEELRPIYALETESMREQGWISLYQQAQPLMEAGDYVAAAEILEGANALYKQRPEIMIVLGQIYAQEQDPDRAIARLREAQQVIETRSSEVDSTMAASWAEQALEIPVTIAQAYVAAERYPEAIQELRGLVVSHPDDPQFAKNLAAIFVESEMPDSAAVIYDQLLARTDLAPLDLYQIGIGFYQMEAYDRAADAFSQAVAMAPRDRDAAELWARSVQLGLPEEPTPEQVAAAVTAAEKWVELDPNSNVAKIILAQAVNRGGDSERAGELVQEIEAMPVGITDLQLRRNADGGASLSGSVQTLTAEPGTPVTLQITFYDRAGNALGSETARVTTGAKDSKAVFRVEFDSEQTVDGYSYQIQM